MAVERTCVGCGDAFTVRWPSNPKKFCTRDCYHAHREAPLSERFWAMVDRRGPEDCWLWTGDTSPRGYARIWGGADVGRRVPATHASWFLRHGKWPVKWMLHKCDNPSCVNPGHLFEGDQADNMADASAKGRKLPGEANHQAVLTEQQVVEIRRRYTPRHRQHGATALGKEFGVSTQTIWIITQRKGWRHVA